MTVTAAKITPRDTSRAATSLVIDGTEGGLSDGKGGGGSTGVGRATTRSRGIGQTGGPRPASAWARSSGGRTMTSSGESGSLGGGSGVVKSKSLTSPFSTRFRLSTPAMP
jgi:hypothetical protein